MKSLYIDIYLRYITFIFIWITGVMLWSGKVQAQSQVRLQTYLEDYHSILLEWDSDNVENVFEICRRAEGEQEYKVIATLSGETGTVRCHDYDVTLGKKYSYKIVLLNDNEVACESEECALRVSLPVPGNFKGKIEKQSRIKLSWNKVAKAKNYTIYKSKKANKGYKKIATVKKNAYTDYDISRGETYYYKVVANHKKKAYSSEKSSAICIYGKPVAPDVVGSYAKKKIKLTWQKVKGANLYYVYKKNSEGKYNLVQKTEKLYYTDSNVTYKKRYYYKVTAVKKANGKNIKGDSSIPCEVLAMELDPNKKMVALTYDDGPGPYTKEILKCLKENQSKATFFVLGSKVNSYQTTLKEADKIGCEIGNHSYSHVDLTRLSSADVQAELYNTDEAVKKIIGKKTTLMRPPYGNVNTSMQSSLSKPIMLWSIDTMDWSHRDSNKTINEVMSKVKDGDVVLMHDIHVSTKNASLTLIPKLRRAGYQLVTVSELAAYRGYKMEKGVSYHRFSKKK